MSEKIPHPDKTLLERTVQRFTIEAALLAFGIFLAGYAISDGLVHIADAISGLP